MKNKILLIFIITIFHINILYAQNIPAEADSGKDVQKSEKVFFFNFQDKSLVNEYGYLSYIIPNSISADLKNLGDYELKTLSVKMNYLEKDTSSEERTNYISALNQRGQDLKADYLITGAFFIEGNMVTIESQIFDTKRQEILYVKETKDKISAILLKMIEEITNNINKELERAKELWEEERRREEEERKANISPFIGLYNFFSGLTFGIDYGRVNLLNEWGDVFNKTDEISLNLSYELANFDAIKGTLFFKNIAISGKFDYFSARSKEYYYYSTQYLDFTGYTFNIAYLLRLSQFFNFALQAGGGIANVEIFQEGERDQDGNIISPSRTFKDKNNPYYSISLSMNFFLSNLKVESGFAYNRVQYSPKQIDFTIIYFGLGYRI